MKIQWMFRIGLIACAIALGILNLTLWQQRAEVVPSDDEFEVVNLEALPETNEPQLVNEAWEITDMATAHGAFVIEVEADDPSRTEEIGRSLVEPIKGDYDEILVYINQRGDESDLPARRMQWTPAGGYVELEYASEDDSAR